MTDNKNNCEWQTTTNKKKDGGSTVIASKAQESDIALPVVTMVNKPALDLNNSFSSLDDSNDEKENKHKKISKSSQRAIVERQTWGDMHEPNVDEVSSTLMHNIDRCDHFEQRMDLLRESIAVIVDTAASLMKKQHSVINKDATKDREKVKGLHELGLFGSAFTLSMSDNLLRINATINDIEKQKNDILDGWDVFIQNLNPSNEKNNTEQSTERSILQRPPSNASFINALEGGRHVDTRNPTILITATIGSANVKSPVTSNIKNIPLMCIQYSAALSCYVINLDGDMYSFGTGKFTSRKGKNVDGDSVLYNKRCNPREMNCSGASCTYYHDPLKFANNAHLTRNMAIPYITEDLIKGIATDREIVSNTSSYEKNPFIVEDIVQLAGMLLLKALAVKSVIKSNSTQSRSRKQYRH
jgi:hypothetical protein